jgi:hypothetical protein
MRQPDTEVDVARIAPTHDNIIVTCGRNNIRIWRVKNSLLWCFVHATIHCSLPMVVLVFIRHDALIAG